MAKNIKQKSMRYDQYDYMKLMESNIICFSIPLMSARISSSSFWSHLVEPLAPFARMYRGTSVSLDSTPGRHAPVQERRPEADRGEPAALHAVPRPDRGPGDTAALQLQIGFRGQRQRVSLLHLLGGTGHLLQTEGLEMVVPCEARTAGVLIYYPMSLLIGVGVC